MRSETQEMRRRWCVQAARSQREGAQVAQKVIRQRVGFARRVVSDGGWGLSSSRATGRACDEPLCLSMSLGESAQSEMASDGEVVSGLNAPNWAGEGTGTATGTDAAAGE
jgi:hypothetical protein